MELNAKIASTTSEIESIIQLRYEVLRAPWGQPKDTATDELEPKSVNAYIAVNTEVIACGRLQEKDGKVGQVRFMAVAKNYQGKGLGEKILTQLELVAKEKQLAKIELQARENAVKFYEKNGYSIVQSSFLLWGQIQHYLMQKIL
jgi:N-acetylglutamate synthase-like GNAT family acetyltransferase